MKRIVVIAVGAAVAVLASTGAALAMSDGHYSYEKQHCTGSADNYTAPDRVEPECRNFMFSVSDGNDAEWGHAGLRQTPDGTPVDPTNPDIAAGPGGDPTTGAKFYFGADDNLDNGEHDSSPLVNNGPSDGGGIQLNVLPASVDPWLAALAGGDVPYLLTHPIPLVDGGFGACADGICFAATTQRRTAFDGGAKNKGKDKDTPVERDAANYEGKEWDPETCGGPSDQPEDCGGKHDLAWWNKKEGKVYLEPGVQIYEDPDAQGSPIGPYPLPAAYVGTCGVILGGGSGVPAAPASPITNSAGQLVVGTGCHAGDPLS